MEISEIKQLQINATKARMGAIIGTYNAKSGHPGGSLSAADVLTYLYFKEMMLTHQTLSGQIEIDLFFQRVIQHLHFMQYLH